MRRRRRTGPDRVVGVREGREAEAREQEQPLVIHLPTAYWFNGVEHHVGNGSAPRGVGRVKGNGSAACR